MLFSEPNQTQTAAHSVQNNHHLLPLQVLQFSAVNLIPSLYLQKFYEPMAFYFILKKIS